MDFRIEIEGGSAFAVPAHEDTLLRAALRAGIGLPHECNVGGCGACRFDLIAGEVEDLWPEAPGLSARDRQRGKKLACQARPRSDCRIRVRCSDEYKPVVPPQHRPARLIDRHALTEDLIAVTLRTEDPARFRPGQYALLTLPGIAGVRAYSMANQPNNAGDWRFIIRPVGAGSRSLTATLGLGDTIGLDGPYGHAWFRPDAGRPVICLAGGSGLAPMLSVAVAAAAAGVDVHFFEGARRAEQLCAAPLLAELGPHLRRHIPVLSDAAGDWPGETGFLHQALARQIDAPWRDREYYFAGPPPMVEAVQTLLLVEQGVPFQQLHYDRFL